MFERGMRPLIRDSHVEPAENAIGVFAPRCRNRGRGDSIFENKIPANDPRDEFAHGRVGIGVSTPGNGNHRCKFGVTKACEGAADPRHNKGKHHRRTRAVSDRRRRANKQAGANDPADSERDQVHPTE